MHHSVRKYEVITMSREHAVYYQSFSLIVLSSEAFLSIHCAVAENLYMEEQISLHRGSNGDFYDYTTWWRGYLIVLSAKLANEYTY